MSSRRCASRTFSYSTRFRISEVSSCLTDQSSRPYAAARTRIGCFACRPVPCSIWSAASGQSVAVTGASARVIASNRGLASFRESSWYCVLKPQVPSTAEHFSTTSTVAEKCSARSEEHTSELQSRLHLVCRLLLEKKK